MAFKTHGQRKAFFANLKNKLTNVQKSYADYQEDRHKKHVQAVKSQTRELEREEKKVRAELAAAQAENAERQKVDQLKAQLAEAKRLKFEQSSTGKSLAAVKSAGSKIGSQAAKDAKFLLKKLFK